ncbi:MAG: hypothetical protein ACRCSG_07370 [Cellulosilyticaceae bacterium]
MGDISNKFIRGFVLYNNTNRELFLQIKSKKSKNLHQSKMLKPGAYSGRIFLEKFHYEKMEEITISLKQGNDQMQIVSSNKLVYHPGGEGRLLTLEEENSSEGVVRITTKENSYKSVIFNNHAAVVAKCEVYYNANDEGIGAQSIDLFWRSAGLSVGRSEEYDFSDCGMKDLTVCFPKANVTWAKDVTSEPFIYSENSPYQMTYELKGTAFKKNIRIL